MATKIVVIGGGFYGCIIALQLYELGKDVTILEAKNNIMLKASANNQARIHCGYHYPRSLITSLRTQKNFKPFTEEFSECIDSSFDKYYLIARRTSKVNALQFRTFCRRIGAPIVEASNDIKKFFNMDMIENVFKVHEYAFNVDTLRSVVLNRIKETGIELSLSSQVKEVTKNHDIFEIAVQRKDNDLLMKADYVYNCTYSSLNHLFKNDPKATIALKYQHTEIALIEVPKRIKDIAITVMDGPFFSYMPFPSRKLHSLSHVRYTPHVSWNEGQIMPAHPSKSAYQYMIKDAARYMPILIESNYVESIWETKAIMPRSELDDSRPILYKEHPTLKGFYSILGGKIDNIFDIREKIIKTHGGGI